MSDVLAKLKKLDEERAKLLDEAKATALSTAEKAVEDLNSLGFNYRLVEGGRTVSSAPRQQSTGTRRTGIRKEVLQVVTDAGPDGIATADVQEKLGMRETASDRQSVSNALTNLKKVGKIAQNGSLYSVP